MICHQIKFMEYFVFEPRFLSDLSKHCETGESIPTEVIQKLQLCNQSIKCNELLHRLFLGELEQQLNSTFDPYGDDSILALQRNCAEKLCPNHIPPKGNIDPLIQILESNAKGKMSVQYRYLWSEVMSADLFLAFQEVIENGDEVALRALGKQFRKHLLDPGASISTNRAFVAFRGRPPSQEALLQLYGLK